MVLSDVIKKAKDLQFALCITMLDSGYYYPARVCNKVHFVGAMLHREVRCFTIDYEEKVVFANIRGCDND